MIEDYDFGVMVIGGRRYTRDLILVEDRIYPNWWRKEGHSLCLDDLKVVLNERPDILVIGTGYSGVMEVPKEVVEKLESMGISVIVEPTPKAYKTFNKLLREGKRVAGAFHLTC